MSNDVTDVLSWDEFLKHSKARVIYPPKQVELFNRLIGHTKNFFLISAYGAFTPGYVMLITKAIYRMEISLINNLKVVFSFSFKNPNNF